MKETHDSREDALAKMVNRHFPELVLRSRVGIGIFGNPVSRLRFEHRKIFGWFWKIFLNPEEAENYSLALTVTGYDHSGLDLESGHSDIEIHLYDHRLAKAAERFTAEYFRETGKSVVLVLEAGERPRVWTPFKRFAGSALFLIAVFLGLRVLSAVFLNAILNQSP